MLSSAPVGLALSMETQQEVYESQETLLQEGMPIMENKSANDSDVPSSIVQVSVHNFNFVAALPAGVF